MNMVLFRTEQNGVYQNKGFLEFPTFPSDASDLSNPPQSATEKRDLSAIEGRIKEGSDEERGNVLGHCRWAVKVSLSM